MELKWYCSFCEQHLCERYSGFRLLAIKSPKEAAAERLLTKVGGHIDFHAWQFANEIEYGWLEEDQG